MGEFVYLMAMCPPMKFGWLLMVDDDLQVPLSSLASICSSTAFSLDPMVGIHVGCCVMLNDVAVRRVSEKLQVEGSYQRFQNAFSITASGNFSMAAAGLLQFLIDEVQLSVDRDLSDKLMQKTLHPVQPY